MPEELYYQGAGSREILPEQKPEEAAATRTPGGSVLLSSEQRSLRSQVLGVLREWGTRLACNLCGRQATLHRRNEGLLGGSWLFTALSLPTSIAQNAPDAKVFVHEAEE